MIVVLSIFLFCLAVFSQLVYEKSGARYAFIRTVHVVHCKALDCSVYDVIHVHVYQTQETAFHRDNQTPRRELKM